MISKACKYALRAVIFVASKVGDNVKFNVKDIAKEIDAPEAFTAKILQELNKYKIITSLKGPYGGFFIEPYQLNIPLLRIVNDIDGMDVFRECGLGLKQCSESHPCPMHNQYKQIRNELLHVFETTTIGDLANNLKAGNYYIGNYVAKNEG